MTIDERDRAWVDRVREVGLVGRRRVSSEMRRAAFLRVWAQADRAGAMTRLELTRFLLRRLYPDLQGERLEAVMARFAELEASGRWAGPQRPPRVAVAR